MKVEFEAFEYGADGGLSPRRFRFDGDSESGWRVEREGTAALELGPGYRLLRTARCGVCSTDLARRFLPFPLPQITGHEVVALDDDGRRYAVEINAPPCSRGVSNDCAFCGELSRHCPDRLVLGIHDLPGGFGPYLLAPVHALHALPDALDDDAAVLVEPLAAALRAVELLAPENGQSVAVLGPRKLGMLVIAALAAWRRKQGRRFEIAAMARRSELLRLAAELGADRTHLVKGDEAEPPRADIVIDTTGSPEGLDFALRAANEEVHLKSTHGRPAAGLRGLTDLVVDELSIARLPEQAPEAALPATPSRVRPLVAWRPWMQPAPSFAAAADIRITRSFAALARELERYPPEDGLTRADAAVAASLADIESAIRPFAGTRTSLLRPGGTILLSEFSGPELAASPLVRAVRERGLRLSSSRCGDFAGAIALLAGDAGLREAARRSITQRFPASELPAAFVAAAGRDSIKVVVEHGGEGGVR